MNSTDFHIEMLIPGVCSEMIPVTVSFKEKISVDKNWELSEFSVERLPAVWNGMYHISDGYDGMTKYGKNDEEYKSKGKHSKQVYDWEILEQFFLHHNLVPKFYPYKYQYVAIYDEVKKTGMIII